LSAIAKGYGAYHRQLEGAEGAPLSGQTYGAAGLYCYYSRLPAGHEVFQYLGEDKSTSLAKVKAKYLVTADGSSAFHASQLLALSNFPVTPGQVAATPQQLLPPVAAPVRPPCDSPMANAQTQNLLEPKEEKEPNPQPRNPYRCTAVPLAQPILETEPQNRNGTDPPSEAQVLALTGNARPVAHRICTFLEDLVLPLFLKISDSTKEDQVVQKANAKLEAALKKKATLDMGQALDDSIAKEPTVAHKKMEGLVQSIVQRQLKNEGKRKKNEIVKEALKEARKKSSGGEKGKNTKRNKQRNGETQSEQSKNSASPSQPPKHVKRKQSNNPDRDYAQWQHWQQNLYWSQGPPHTPPDNPHNQSGRGSSKGRGRGRRRGRGGSNRGRGRGRGRS
jgi:hypothetical protein